MKILHITDSHGTVKSPEGRRDIYYITFLKKLYELGFVCKKFGIDMVIHTGDLFHTARVSNKFAGQVSEMIKAMGVPFYVVPGNHDIEGYNTDTIDQTMLGLLAKTGVVQLLDRDHPIMVTDNQDGEEYTVAISGQEYYSHIDEGNTQDFAMQQDEADLNILAIHGYIADTPQHPSIKCTMVQDVITDADIILTGHYHRQFEWWDGNSLDIYNPGSMMRVEQTEYNKTHMPQYGILSIGLNENGEIQFDYKFHQFRVAQPSTTVFDYDKKYKQKHASITLDGFKTSLANTMATLSPTSNILTIIDDLCAKNNIPKDIQVLTEKIYNTTLQSVPDEFEAQQGYIEAQQIKKISSVELHNFQSHEDTNISFDDGLNIIVGESNNGKTAIIRGMMWVIDNAPLGTDFIMAGKNDCKVRINYSDGTFIERGRTIKDTGYYRIGFYDENGVLQDATYRGFTNAIPVEVANTHQMPKVNITKDIETHLNVLSQLDAPFLITESPQVKAAAIGRITGTHVIDAAVKKNNLEIRNNNVLIKDIDKNIKETESKISGLPDISLMETVLMSYNSVIAYIKSLVFVINKIETFLKDVSYIESQMVNVKQQYEKDKILFRLKRMVDDADSLFNDTKHIHGMLEEFTLKEQQICGVSNALRIDKTKASLLPLITFADGLHVFITKATTLTGQIKMTEVEESVTANQLELNRKASVIYRKLSSDIEDKISNIGMIETYMKQIAETDKQIELVERDYKSHKKQLQAVKKLMANAQEDKINFIISNGVCPCCGQPITTEDIAQHVSTFMEEQKIG